MQFLFRFRVMHTTQYKVQLLTDYKTGDYWCDEKYIDWNEIRNMRILVWLHQHVIIKWMRFYENWTGRKYQFLNQVCWGSFYWHAIYAPFVEKWRQCIVTKSWGNKKQERHGFIYARLVEETFIFNNNIASCNVCIQLDFLYWILLWICIL